MAPAGHDLVATAEALARQAHAGQRDKQDRDYAEHHLAPVAALLRPFGPQTEAAGKVTTWCRTAGDRPVPADGRHLP